MPPLHHHTDLLIRILAPNGEGIHPVEAALDDGSVFEGGHLHLDRERLLLDHLDPFAYGRQLFECLFAGPIRDAYNQAAGRARERTENRLRVRLRIDPQAVDLHALPWERLYHIHKGLLIPLSTSARTPFSRYTALPEAEPNPITERPLRLLIALSNPERLPPGLAPLDVAHEVNLLHDALGDLNTGHQLQVTVLPGRTGLPEAVRAKLEHTGYRIEPGPTQLDTLLRLVDGRHLVHFIGHGHFRDGQAALFLEDETGNRVVVTDDELVPKLAALDAPPALVFLSACESAKREPRAAHPFVGLGPKLVEAGVPAVIAMQDVVPMDVAQQVTGDFYRRLLEHGLVDQAMNEARNLLFEADDIDWAIPVLFTRLQTGALFTADPLQAALRSVSLHRPHYLWPENGYLPMPVEVAPLADPTDPALLDRLDDRPVPTLDLIPATQEAFARPEPGNQPRVPRGRLLVLVGDHGMAKSTQMHRLTWVTAETSLQAEAARRIVPIYIDLTAYPDALDGADNPLCTLAARCLQKAWPALTEDDFAALLADDRGPTVRFLLDGSDDLDARHRREAWTDLDALRQRAPRHQFVLAINPLHFQLDHLEHLTAAFSMRPLSRCNVEDFLIGLGPTGVELCRALERAQLFDLAGVPWMLARLVQAARDGRFPESRAAVVRSALEERLAKLPTRRGLQVMAEPSLYELSWLLQSTRRTELDMGDAFNTLATVRGNREYSLEDLCEAMIEARLLACVGRDGLRMAYPALQAYGAAQVILHRPDAYDLMDDIIASLGRLTRLRWWGDTLILLSDLLPNPSPLIRQILYGVDLTVGEHVFLAVSCCRRASLVDPDVITRLIDALTWRTNSLNEPRAAYRVRAASALGQLRLPAVLPHLVQLANDRVRLDWKGERDYELSSVRMAASIGLQRMMPDFETEIERLDPGLTRLLRLWTAENVQALSDALHGDDVNAQSLAAFALGELHKPEAEYCLLQAFRTYDTPPPTRWAVTDALLRLDPMVVTRKAILPFLDEAHAERERLERRTWKRRASWYSRVAYLIGRLTVKHPATEAFLERCLHTYKDVHLKGKAIQALGRLHVYAYKDEFEQIATGRFDTLPLRAQVAQEDTAYLSRSAIEALATLGDAETLDRLRPHRATWDPLLEQAFYRTSEEIAWRMQPRRVSYSQSASFSSNPFWLTPDRRQSIR